MATVNSKKKIFSMLSRTHNVDGQITINGQERNLKRFRRQTAYILQDHDLHSFITVMEAMHFSANLKIGSEMTQADKKLRVSMSMFDKTSDVRTIDCNSPF